MPPNKLGISGSGCEPNPPPDEVREALAVACKHSMSTREKAAWKTEFKLPWCEAGPPNHRDDKVDSDSLCQLENKLDSQPE